MKQLTACFEGWRPALDKLTRYPVYVTRTLGIEITGWQAFARTAHPVPMPWPDWPCVGVRGSENSPGWSLATSPRASRMLQRPPPLSSQGALAWCLNVAAREWQRRRACQAALARPSQRGAAEPLEPGPGSWCPPPGRRNHSMRSQSMGSSAPPSRGL